MQPKAPDMRDSDDSAVARAVRAFVYATQPITALWAVASIYQAPSTTPWILAQAGAFMSLGLTSLWLASHGRPRLGAALMAVAFWLVCALSAYLEGGVRSTVYVAFSAMILMAGVLWSTAAAFVMTGCSIALGGALVWLEGHGLLPAPHDPDTPLGAWLAACMVFGTVATLQLLSARVGRENLSRARAESFQRHIAEQESVHVTRELEASERRYRHIFESAAVALFELDLAPLAAWHDQFVAARPGQDALAELRSSLTLVDELAARARITDANDAALRMLELKDKSKLLGDLVPRFDDVTRKNAMEFILSLLVSPDVVERELVVKTFEGRRRYVLMTGRAPSLPARRERVVVSGVDITEKRLREERSRATQRLEAIGRLAAGVAHDFNNALVVIMSWASLLRKPGRTEAEREEGLDAITGAAARAADLVRRLLSIGRREVRAPRPTSVGALIDETLRALTRLLPADVRVSVSQEGEFDVIVDEAQLQQVLLNLALNARDAMPEGGLIELRTRACSREQTQDLDPSQRYVEIAVRDTGVGMDRATQERIFEPFFSTKAEGRGTGLGLATAAAVIAESHGKIYVESAPGHGSCFRVVLPLADEHPVALPLTAAEVGPQGGRTVLLVEDEEPVRQVLVQTLVTAGYEVLQAGDGQTALELLRARPQSVHMLCTDGILPGIPTRQLIDEFQARFPHAPVLVCSGHVREELLRRGIASGELSFLAKPFQPEALVRRVQELLGQRPHG